MGEARRRRGSGPQPTIKGRNIRIRGVIEVDRDTIGIGSTPRVLVCYDDLGKAHALCANPKGVGWVQLTDEVLPTMTKEEIEEYKAMVEKAKQEAADEAQRKADERIQKENESGIVTGDEAVACMSSLPAVPPGSEG
jgi:hypothetical protein